MEFGVWRWELGGVREGKSVLQTDAAAQRSAARSDATRSSAARSNVLAQRARLPTTIHRGVGSPCLFAS